MQIEIQIVDTHESLETRVVIGLQAFGHHLNRTLLGEQLSLLEFSFFTNVESDLIFRMTNRLIWNSLGIIKIIHLFSV